jgi:hypothetical protein
MQPEVHQAPVMIASMAAGFSYNVTWNDAPVPFHERYPGILETQHPATPSAGTLSVSAGLPLNVLR